MKARVLLVDDAAIARIMQRKILEEKGYVVIGEASTGIEAFDKYRELKPDIMILDIMMTGMDGIETLRNIKMRYSDARVIMCSSLWKLGKVVASLVNGASDFVTKPFQRDRFLFTVDGVVLEKRVFNTETLTQLSVECENRSEMTISQDQISELIQYTLEKNPAKISASEILERLGLPYQEDIGLAKSDIERLLVGQEKIIDMLKTVLSKMG